MLEKPLITIGMAVYKPNEEWFIEQLQSIDNQDYEPIELLIWNDSPLDYDCKDIVAKTVKRVSYQILDNGKNNGVTKAFELVTAQAHGRLIAYSDQDDIWNLHKISIMVDFMEQHPDCICCHSDVELIDEKGHTVRKTIFPEHLDKINKRKYQEKIFLTKSWNVGCAMMMQTRAAKAAIPFPGMVYHDQWLEMYALSLGKFYYLPACLIQHRVHGNNNSQTLRGICCKQDYYRVKLNREVTFFDYLTKNLPCHNVYENESKWIRARKKYSQYFSVISFFQLFHYLWVRPAVTGFELLLPFIPNGLFRVIVKAIRKEIKILGYR